MACDRCDRWQRGSQSRLLQHAQLPPHMEPARHTLCQNKDQLQPAAPARLPRLGHCASNLCATTSSTPSRTPPHTKRKNHPAPTSHPRLQPASRRMLQRPGHLKGRGRGGTSRCACTAQLLLPDSRTAAVMHTSSKTQKASQPPVALFVCTHTT